MTTRPELCLALPVLTVVLACAHATSSVQEMARDARAQQFNAVDAGAPTPTPLDGDLRCLRDELSRAPGNLAPLRLAVYDVEKPEGVDVRDRGLVVDAIQSIAPPERAHLIEVFDGELAGRNMGVLAAVDTKAMGFRCDLIVKADTLQRSWGASLGAGSFVSDIGAALGIGGEDVIDVANLTCWVIERTDENLGRVVGGLSARSEAAFPSSHSFDISASAFLAPANLGFDYSFLRGTNVASALEMMVKMNVAAVVAQHFDIELPCRSSAPVIASDTTPAPSTGGARLPESLRRSAEGCVPSTSYWDYWSCPAKEHRE